MSPVHMPPENVQGEEERECVIASCCAQKARHPYHSPDFLHTWCLTSACLEAVLSTCGTRCSTDAAKTERDFLLFSLDFVKTFANINLQIKEHLVVIFRVKM